MSDYEGLFMAVPIGENCLTIDADGRVIGAYRKNASEKSQIWKGAQKIMQCSDDAIRSFPARASGIQDYQILGVSVSWGHGRTRRKWLCHTHLAGNCPHVKRIKQWKADHSNV
jgi:hypothetical protein